MLNDKQMIWRCRRGVRELDVLFSRFLKDAYPNLNPTEKEAFQALLDVQDPTIMDWLFEREVCEDTQLAFIIGKLQALSGE